MIVRNATRGTLLADRCRLADTIVSRGVGLLLSAPLAEGEGLRITAQGLNLTDEPFITNGFT